MHQNILAFDGPWTRVDIGGSYTDVPLRDPPPPLHYEMSVNDTEEVFVTGEYDGVPADEIYTKVNRGQSRSAYHFTPSLMPKVISLFPPMDVHLSVPEILRGLIGPPQHGTAVPEESIRNLVRTDLPEAGIRP